MPNPPTKLACGRAGGASGGRGQGGSGRAGPREGDIDRTESIAGTEHDGSQSDRTEYLPARR
eukprot:9258307-Alexandrium_andersonii.AAC.1